MSIEQRLPLWPRMTRRTIQWNGRYDEVEGIDAATAFTIEMLSNLERAIEHEDMTEELAEILSTETVRLTYEVNTAIDVDSE